MILQGSLVILLKTMLVPGSPPMTESNFHWVVSILLSIKRTCSNVKMKIAVPYLLLRAC